MSASRAVPLSVAGLVLYCICSTAAVADPPLAGLAVTRIWEAVPGSTTVLAAADLDGDGAAELVGHSDEYWPHVYVLERLGGSYESVFVTPMGWLASGFEVADADSDGDLDLVIVMAESGGHRLAVYDGTTRQLLREFALLASGAVRIGDLDRDGHLEAVCSQAQAVQVYRLADGQSLWQATDWGGDLLALGNVDADPALEIVAGSAQSITVADGVTRQIEWTIPGGLLGIADVDDDGLDEVFEQAPGHVDVYDADTQILKYRLPFPLDFAGLLDADGDGALEIAVHDSLSGLLQLHSGATGGLERQITLVGHLVSLVAGDFDGDGDRELLFGMNSTEYMPPLLRIANWATLTSEWELPIGAGEPFAIDSGDLDLDGQEELLFAWRSASGWDGPWFVYNGATLAREYAHPPITAYSERGHYRIRQGNLDDDPQPEIVLAGDENWNALLIAYDGLDHHEEWRTAVSTQRAPGGDRDTRNSFPHLSLGLADVDGDGQVEVVAGNQGYSPSIVVLDGRTGTEEWRNDQPWAGNTSLLELVNLDADPQLEIVIGEACGPFLGFDLLIYDGLTHDVQLRRPSEITALDTPDLDADGRAEIFIAAPGRIEQIDAASGEVLQTLLVTPTTSVVRALDFFELAPGLMGYAYTQDYQLYVRTLAGEAAWSSDVRWRWTGQFDSIHVADLDADGWQEIALNAFRGLDVYKVQVRYYGDLNCDRVVDALDINPFVQALVNPAAYAALHPDCDATLADVDRDGAVNALDIAPFVRLLMGD